MTGVIETTAVSLIADELGREIERRPRGFLFDLTKVEYISSSGWGQFARAFDATHAVVLVGMGPDLLEVYECLEFRAFIPAFATEGEGMRALQTAAGGNAGAAAALPPLSIAPAPAPSEVHDEGLDDVLSSPPADGEAPRITAPPEPVHDVPNEKPMWGRRDKRDFNDAPSPSKLDVDSAVSDRNKDRDKKLRSIGWEQYGKRLRGDGENNNADGGRDDGDDNGENDEK